MVIIPIVTAQVEVKLILYCSTVAYIVFNIWLFRPILRPGRWVRLVLKLLCNDRQNRPGITSLRMLKISGNLQNLLAFASHAVWMTSATDHTVSMIMREWWRQSALHLQKLHTQLSFQVNVACDWCKLSCWSSPVVLNNTMQSVTVKAILFLTSKLSECVLQ